MSSRHVLVVEDDEDIREIMCELLEDNGYQTSSAPNGAEALAQLRSPKPRPDIILLDLMMPVMDGRTFRREQLADPALANIPVIVISAYRDMVQDMAEMRAAAFLQKPPSMSELVQLIESILGSAVPNAS